MVFFILLLCASLPPSVRSAELIGVARTTGPAQINGMSLPGQVNVFSGDRIGTGQDSTLTLSSGPQERVRLAAMSGAQVALEEGNLVISLEKGALGFESMGRTRITLKAYDVAIQGQGDFPVVAEVSFLPSGKARVNVLKGQVQVSGAGQLLSLKSGEVGLIASTQAGPQSGSSSQKESSPSTQLERRAEISPPQETGSVAATVVDTRLFVVEGATIRLESFVVEGATITLESEERAGIAFQAQTDRMGSFSLDGIPAGRYKVTFTKRGYRPFTMGPVEVTPGALTDLGQIILAGGGGGSAGGSKTGVILVGVGAAAAAGAGLGLASGGGSAPGSGPTLPPVSPSIPN